MDLVNYIYTCIKPQDSREFVMCKEFDADAYNNLVQDGFLTCNSIPDVYKAQLRDYIHIDNYFIIRKVIRELFWLNDIDDTTFNWDTTDTAIYRRLLPPPVETVNHTKIISIIAKELLYKHTSLNYLEYGVRSGDNFHTISSSNSSGSNVGVDLDISNVPASKILQQCKLYEMHTDTFSKTILPNLDNLHLVFIDADHSSKSAFNDFLSVFDHVLPGGFIILHDTYPCAPEYLDINGCYDCYKVPLLIKKEFSEKVEILTLPLNPGVTIVRKL